MLSINPTGEGWSIEQREGRCYLVQRMALATQPVMIVRSWFAPGLREYVSDTPGWFRVEDSRNGLEIVGRGIYRPIALTRPTADADSTVEEPIKPPRGKWRWNYGRWESLAKR